MRPEPTTEQQLETEECLKTFAKQLELYFNHNGINRSDQDYVKKVASALDMQKSTVNAIFAGQRLTTPNLIKLADYLHVSTDYLLGLSKDVSSVETYSDAFFYLKYMIDHGILVQDSYAVQQWLPGPDHISHKMIDGEEDIPSSHLEEVWYKTFRLAGKFDTLISQYLKIAEILQYDPEYLANWRELTLSRLDAAPSHKKVDFHSRFKEIQESRKITNKELKNRLNLSESYMISKYRNGAYPVPKLIVKMAKCLNVSTDHLLGLSSNFDRNVSERDIFKFLIYLCHSAYFCRYTHAEPNPADFIRVNNPIFYQFCVLYTSRIAVCTDTERMDFFKEISKRFSYSIITTNDMPYFDALTLPDPPKTTYYMEDYAERLHRFYVKYHDGKPSEHQKAEKKQETT